MDNVEMNGKSVQDMAKELSEISRNTGKISFKVSYTATDGNIDIHKKFQEFCFKHCNNEYLAGIGKLLDLSNFMEYIKKLDDRVTTLEQQMTIITTQPEDTKEPEFKTF